MSEPYRVVSALPTGTAFSRYLMVKAAAAGDVYTELVLAEKFKDSPTVHATLELQTKAAVAVRHDERCDLGRTACASTGLPAKRSRCCAARPSSARSNRECGGCRFGRKWRARPAAARAAPGSGKGWRRRPRRPPTTRSRQEAYKAAKIVVLSDELLKLGDPDAERTVRETVIAGVAAYLDAQFLDEHGDPCLRTCGRRRLPTARRRSRRPGRRRRKSTRTSPACSRRSRRTAAGSCGSCGRTTAYRDCGDHRRDSGGGYSADAVRDSDRCSASNSPAADHARRRGAYSLQRHRRIRRRHLHASGDSA